MIEKFKYIKPNGEITYRNVLIVHNTTDKWIGFDLNYLNESEKGLVLKQFGKHVHTHTIPEKSDNLYEATHIPKEIWKKSYRMFNKSNIVL